CVISYYYQLRIIINLSSHVFFIYLKCFNVKLYMNATYFGETLEITGQAENYRLKLSPKKASQQYEVLNKKETLR
ncbi:hypothetical protein, partial [Staphylococcus shinii]|uniref:hypothetical protein n=1 Tax=Staphylococcus shinii TaxID=2912228 RepID=UPI001C712402